MNDIADTYKKKQMKVKFLEELKSEISSGNVLVAANRLGYNRTFMYQIRKEDAVFEREWDDIVLESKARLADEAENGLRRLVLKEHPTAIIFTLKNLRPKDWRDRTEISHVEKRFKDYGEYRKYCEENGLNPDTGLRISSGSAQVEQSTENKDIS